MPAIDLSKDNWQNEALKADGPTCLVIRAWMKPVGELDRFQPAGFPEVGHVVYDAPRGNGTVEKVCIVDSPASMANHLEAVCVDGATGLHPDLQGLPYVRCVTDREDVPKKDDPHHTLVCTTLTEGHRLASDYFLDGLVELKWQEEQRGKNAGKGKAAEAIPAQWVGTRFRDKLRVEFKVTEIRKDKTYFIKPEAWWQIYKTVFTYDPNSLVHGVLFAKEQIKISRLLTAHHEALGAAQVDRSGVKFDRLGKTTSGQPIFAVDEETAQKIVITFILDLALLRSYGRDDKGLNESQKCLLLNLAIWKIRQLLQKPFRFRSGCHLACTRIAWCDETGEIANEPSGKKDTSDGKGPVDRTSKFKATDLKVDIASTIKNCKFPDKSTDVYYPAADLFKPPKEDSAASETETVGESSPEDERIPEE